MPNANDGASDSNADIVVTGSLFRRTNTETASPVTVLTSETLAQRGITNVSDAVRSISADNSGTIPNAFTAGFGGGSSAPSLRGLTVNSTLTLVDGQRMANYPASDDGQRAFVDLNTISRVAIERVEVLKDGASSTYGADAIGGVVNVIMRKQFNGYDITAEAGTSQHGGGGQFRASVLAGWGDYEANGVNFYVGAEYELNKKIFARDRGFPFNTNDLSSIDGGLNLNRDNNGLGGTPTPAIVRPAIQTTLDNNLSGVAIPGGKAQLLFPEQCGALEGTLTTGSFGQSCQMNQVALYGEIQPKTERFGLTGRGSVRLSDTSEAYMMLSWYRSNLTTGGEPIPLRTVNPVFTAGFTLNNYICSAGVNCAAAPDRQLNPYNPYAANGPNPELRAAQLFYRFAEVDPNGKFKSDVLRGAAGINGTFGDAWDYQVDGVASISRLRYVVPGAISLAGFTFAVNTGQYNFQDPDANSEAIKALVNPGIDYTANAGLYALQGVVTRELAQLSGGPLMMGVGAHFRHESLDNPNGNPTGDFITFNQVNSKGERNVTAGFIEISAPLIRQLELQFSGRYDKYSTGFSAFSPKAGFKFTPIPQIALRGTWSKGFRAPSFSETSGQVTGFTAFTAGSQESACVQHGGTFNPNNNRCTGGSPYVGPGALGFRSNATPDLDPEKSTSFTLGTILQPLRWLSFTVDYYNIEKRDIIVAAPLSGSALTNYYAGMPLPNGYSVILNAPDPLFPAGIRTIAIIVGPYENASTLNTSGIDFSALAQIRLSPSTRFSSNLEVTDIFKYKYRPCSDKSSSACDTQSYVGTQGPYILSSGAGTPKWRANWSNSIEFGRATVTATAYYVSGYKNTAEDISGAGTGKDCNSAGALYNDDRICKTKSFTSVDLVGSYELTDNVTAYFNVLNLFDNEAPLNPPNYAANNYNPTYTQSGAVGRFFRIGANFRFGGEPKIAPTEPYVAPPPPPPAPPPATQSCPDGSVILATDVCPAPPPPPPPPPPAPERG